MPTPPSHSDDQATHDRLASPLLADVLARQRLMWQRGEHVRVEQLLDDAAPLRDQGPAILDLIYNEMMLREEQGEQPRLDEYVRRFPHLASELELQFRIDPGIEVLPAPHRVQRQPPQPGDTPPAAPPKTWSFTGYEILGELGRGGMGVVYKARQLGLNRLVALKMVVAGASSDPQRLARFRTEAEAAARLQHPNIVQVYDIGEQEGWLFFSLELVEGGSLAEHIAGTPQPPTASARLVETLARAMHAVHQRGIVHRDLKPANILLAGGGSAPAAGGLAPDAKPPAAWTPKITDFGLAKLLDDDTNRTKTGTSLGTPRYMAPEQAGSGAQQVTPAVDTYALGAILYEMLTGQPPFNGATPLDTLEQVRNRDPVPPRRLQPKVPRDLETICLKCLQKEPYRRYASAEALADDLRRFAEGKPIQARPTPAWERGPKWARRHPTLAVAVGGAALVLLGGVGGLAWHDRRMERSYAARQQDFQDALAVLDDVVLQARTADLMGLARFESLRADWLRAAQQYYTRFLAKHRDDPTARLEVGRAYCRLGEIQEELGKVDEAAGAFREAIAIQKGLPSGPDGHRDLGRSCQGLGRALQDSNHLAEAEDSYREALALRERRVNDGADRPDSQRELADTRYFLGTCLARQLGKKEEARQLYEQTLEGQRRLAEAHPDRPEYRRAVARTLNNLGILQKARDRADAEQRFREAIHIQEGLLKKDPGATDVQRELARSYSNLGACLEEAGTLSSTGEREPKEGRELYRQAKEEYDRAWYLLKDLCSRYQTVPACRNEWAGVYRNIGQLLVKIGQSGPARQAYQSAVQLRADLVHECPEVPEYRQKLALAYVDQAALDAEQDAPGTADELYGAALAIQQILVKDFPETVPYRQELGDTWNDLARLRCAESDLSGAREALEEAARLHGALVQAHPDRAAYRESLRNDDAVLAGVLLDAGSYREAAEVAHRLADVFPADRPAERRLECVRAAEVLARCAAAAARDPRVGVGERRELADGYARAAVALLQTACRLGFHDVRGLGVPEYDALRDRSDFQDVLRAMHEQAGAPGG